jgi:hypothetical protein
MAVRLSALCTSYPLPPRKIPGTHFCLRLSRPQGHRAVGRFRSIEKSNDLIEIRSHNLPASSIVPQPTMLPHGLNFMNRYANINYILTVTVASLATFYWRCFCVLFGFGHPSSVALTHQIPKIDRYKGQVSQLVCDWTTVLQQTT